jgi:hypothetical protein
MVKRIQRKLALPIQTYKQSWISATAAATGGEYTTITATGGEYTTITATGGEYTTITATGGEYTTRTLPFVFHGVRSRKLYSKLPSRIIAEVLERIFTANEHT